MIEAFASVQPFSAGNGDQRKAGSFDVKDVHSALAASAHKHTPHERKCAEPET